MQQILMREFSTFTINPKSIQQKLKSYRKASQNIDEL